MAVIGVNYNEGGEPLNYESVYIHTRDDNEHLFNTGNFVKDWFDAKKKINLEIATSDPFLSHSSSVDHFIMDGAPYDSAYLHIIDGKPVLRYLNREDKNWIYTQMEIYEEGQEFFVEDNTQPTWEELKEMCK